MSMAEFTVAIDDDQHVWQLVKTYLPMSPEGQLRWHSWVETPNGDGYSIEEFEKLINYRIIYNPGPLQITKLEIVGGEE